MGGEGWDSVCKCICGRTRRLRGLGVLRKGWKGCIMGSKGRRLDRASWGTCWVVWEGGGKARRPVYVSVCCNIHCVCCARMPQKWVSGVDHCARGSHVWIKPRVELVTIDHKPASMVCKVLVQPLFTAFSIFVKCSFQPSSRTTCAGPSPHTMAALT